MKPGSALPPATSAPPPGPRRPSVCPSHFRTVLFTTTKFLYCCVAGIVGRISYGGAAVDSLEFITIAISSHPTLPVHTFVPLRPTLGMAIPSPLPLTQATIIQASFALLITCKFRYEHLVFCPLCRQIARDESGRSRQPFPFSPQWGRVGEGRDG